MPGAVWDLVRWPLSGGLDERNFVDFFQGCNSVSNLSQRRLAQKAHTILASSSANFRCRLLFQNQLADAVGQIEQFVDGRASFIPGASAFDATFAFIEGEVSPLRDLEATGFELVGRVPH